MIFRSINRSVKTGPLGIRYFSNTLSKMGVTVQSLSPGDGKSFPKPGDKVTMHYIGTLESGKKFDSSRDRGRPFQTQIGVGQVIKGWEEGVPQMSVGEKAILTITGDYGYGDRGFPGLIPPNATLIVSIGAKGHKSRLPAAGCRLEFSTGFVLTSVRGRAPWH